MAQVSTRLSSAWSHGVGWVMRRVLLLHSVGHASEYDHLLNAFLYHHHVSFSEHRIVSFIANWIELQTLGASPIAAALLDES